MKRILLILLCLAFWLPSNASMVRLPYVQDVQAGMVIGSGATGGGSYTDILFWLNFEENDTTGTYDMGTDEYSAGDTSGTYNNNTIEGGSIVANSGTYSLVSNGTSNYMSFDVSSNDIIPAGDFQIMGSIEITTFAAGDYLVLATGTDASLQIQMFGTDEIRVKYKWAAFQECSVTTTNANLVTGTTYFITAKIDTTNNDIEVELDGTVLTDGGVSCDDSSNMGETTAWNIMYGFYTSGDGDVNYGKFIISDDLSRDLYNDFQTTVNSPR